MGPKLTVDDDAVEQAVGAIQVILSRLPVASQQLVLTRMQQRGQANGVEDAMSSAETSTAKQEQQQFSSLGSEEAMAKQLRRYREVVSDWQTHARRKIKRARTDPERDLALEQLANMVIKCGDSM